MQLYKRKVFDKIEPYIGDETVIVLHGARQVGKTHILYYLREWLNIKTKKNFYYDLEYPELLEFFNKGADSLISKITDEGYKKGEDCYVLIDEIQYLDNPSSFLKIIADHYKNIHLIVSGSSTFEIKSKFKNSLAGRTVSFEVFPLDFEEYLEFLGVNIKITDPLSEITTEKLKELYFKFIKYGGYPKVVLENDEEKKKQLLLQLIDTYIRKDIKDLANISDIKKFNNMLKVLASQSGQLLDMQSLSREIEISLITLKKYISILEETYVIKLVSPYSKSASVEITKTPKLFFYDSGLQSILWMNNFQDVVLGSVFETNIFGELSKVFDRKDISFWRTKTHMEIDFVIEKNMDPYIPIEVKLNFGNFNQRAINTFNKKYKLNSWKMIGLNGKKINSSFIYPKENFIYPWEIKTLV
ncbi:MAG: ATP-binding protein [bacterium]|nr:MAG: ATP-binding protein [bacterium]